MWWKEYYIVGKLEVASRRRSAPGIRWVSFLSPPSYQAPAPASSSISVRTFVIKLHTTNVCGCLLQFLRKLRSANARSLLRALHDLNLILALKLRKRRQKPIYIFLFVKDLGRCNSARIVLQYLHKESIKYSHIILASLTTNKLT